MTQSSKLRDRSLREALIAAGVIKPNPDYEEYVPLYKGPAAEDIARRMRKDADE